MKYYTIIADSDKYGSLSTIGVFKVHARTHARQVNDPVETAKDLIAMADHDEISFELVFYDLAGEEVENKTPDLADFIGLGLSLFACSPRSREWIVGQYPNDWSLSGSQVWEDYCLMTPRNTYSCLVVEKSVPRYIPGIRRQMGYQKVAIDESLVSSDVFFVEGIPGTIFCSERFKDFISHNTITGLCFETEFIVGA